MSLSTFPICLMALLCCCAEVERQPEVKVHAVTYTSTIELVVKDEYNRDEVMYDTKTSLWMNSDSSKLTGYVLEFFDQGDLFKKFMVVNGKKEGEQITYFSDGRIKFLEHFHENKMHGEVNRWSMDNGYALVAQLNYSNGKLNGKQMKWYATGEIHKVMHLKEGKEDGLQQAFRKNGALYANYEAKNGRVFGLKRSNLCYELDNEEIIYKQ